MRKAVYYIAIVAFVILGLTIFLCTLFPKPLNQTLPNLDIVFTPDSSVGQIGFTSSNDPNKKIVLISVARISKYISSEITWSPDGKYIATRYSNHHPDDGYPILIHQNGKITFCRNSPWGHGKIWVLSDSVVSMIVSGETIDRIVKFDMDTCQETENLYTGKPGESIREFTLSSSGVIAIEHRKEGIIGEIKISILLQQEDAKDVVFLGSNPMWAPNGEWLAYVSDGIRIINPYSGDIQQISPATANSPYWDSSSSLIIFTRINKELKISELVITNIDTGDTKNLSIAGYGPAWRWETLNP